MQGWVKLKHPDVENPIDATEAAYEEVYKDLGWVKVEEVSSVVSVAEPVPALATDTPQTTRPPRRTEGE